MEGSMDINRARGLLAFALLGVTVAVEAGGVARATTPGKNGKIAFRRYLNDDHSMGVVFVAKADGTGAREATIRTARRTAPGSSSTRTRTTTTRRRRRSSRSAPTAPIAGS
jgi:hypothetical protein